MLKKLRMLQEEFRATQKKMLMDYFKGKHPRFVYMVYNGEILEFPIKRFAFDYEIKEFNLSIVSETALASAIQKVMDFKFDENKIVIFFDKIIPNGFSNFKDTKIYYKDPKEYYFSKEVALKVLDKEREKRGIPEGYIPCSQCGKPVAEKDIHWEEIWVNGDKRKLGFCDGTCTSNKQRGAEG